MRNDASHKEAWLGQVLKDHGELMRLLTEFREFLVAPRPEIGIQGSHTWAATCACQLVDLHEKLFRHFRFEEQDGVLRDLAEYNPRALPEVEALEQEHPEMLEQLRVLVSDVLKYSEGQPPEDSRIRGRISGVLDQLAQHEKVEMELIQRVANREIGEGD